MSIHKTGPKAYEYQYLATVYFVLSLLKENQQITGLRIEAAGSEDAEVLVVEQGKHITLEIQVKTDKENFSLGHLANILCHFGDHSISDNLISRVINNQHKAIIFLKARCSEATEPYLTETGIFGRAHLSPPKNIATLVDLISNYKDTSVRYSDARAHFCEKVGLQLNDALVQESLINNLFVMEKMTSEDLFERAQTLLFKTFHIPFLHSEAVVDKLIKEIRYGRDNGSNVWESFHKVLLSNRSGQPDIKSDYHHRVEEADLVKKLSMENSLFLNGPSFCGKSSIAKAVAKAFTDLNYLYEFTSDYQQAERFLLASDSSDKICIYDDPLGFLYEDGKSYGYLEKIFQLADSLPPGRKLIATANNDVLRRLKADKHPKWIDVSVNDTNQLLEISRTLALNRSVPSEIILRIEQYLLKANKDKQLQPGQIAYIYQNHDQLSTNQDLWAFSALTSERIQQNLEKRGELVVEVFYSLSLVADTIISASDRELSQFYSKQKVLPGIRPFKKGFSIAGFANDVKADKFPKYKEKYKLPKQIGDEIDFLTKCGYIYHSDASTQFSHPVYLQAAKDLIKNIQHTAFKRLMKSLSRGISLLSVGNAQLAAKSLSMLFSYRSDVRERTWILELAWEARRSIYPSVSDIALLFFCDHLPFLKPKDFEKLTEALSNYRFEQSETRWNKGIPYVTNKTKEARVFDRSLITPVEYEDYCEVLRNSEEGYLLPQDAYKVTQYIKKKSHTNPLIVDPNILDRLLDYDEAFIRSVASYHAFHQFSVGDETLIVKVCKDQHPIVIMEAIKGLIAGWHRYDAIAKRALLPQAMNLMQSIPVSISATHLITQFGAGYTGNSFDWLYNIPKKRHTQMWKLWSKFLVVYFENVPRGIDFHVHRFVSSLQTAVEKLPAKENAEILSALITWMKKSAKYTDYDTVLFYVVHHYLGMRDKLPVKQRIYFMNELMDTRFLYLALNSARAFSAYWDKLDIHERTFLTSIIKADTTNLFGQVIITGEGVGEELGKLILGYDNWRHLRTNKKLILSIDTYERCFSILFLTHKLIELDYSDRVNWTKILRTFIYNENENLRYLAIRICLQHYSRYGNAEFHTYWGNPLVTFKKIVSNPDSKNYLTQLLLDELCNFTYSKTLPIWKMLNDSLDEAERISIMAAIAEKIYYVELSDNLRIIDKIWGSGFYEAEFPNDDMIIKLLWKLEEIAIFSNDVIEPAYELIFKAFENQLPKMIVTYDWLLRFIDENGLNMDAAHKKITDLRHAHFERYKTLDRRFKYPAAETYFESIYIELPKSPVEN
jgi:hypothetical protein